MEAPLAEEPKDPQKSKCYYDERVAKLEAIIAKLVYDSRHC